MKRLRVCRGFASASGRRRVRCRRRSVESFGGAGEPGAAVFESARGDRRRESGPARSPQRESRRRRRRRSSPRRLSPPRRAPRRGRSPRLGRRCARPARSSGSGSARAFRAAGRSARSPPGRRRRRRADCRPRRASARPRRPSRADQRRPPRCQSRSSHPAASAPRMLRPPRTLTVASSRSSRAISHAAAIRVPFPDSSAVEPSGFQITIATAPSATCRTSMIPSVPFASSRTRSGVSSAASATR